MRFLVDENIPYSAVERLRGLGHDVVAVRDVMRGAPDEDVLARSRSEDRVLVTADKDFGEMIFARRDLAAGVLLVRSRTSRPAAKVDGPARAGRRGIGGDHPVRSPTSARTIPIPPTAARG